jgi:hypothetical protein
MKRVADVISGYEYGDRQTPTSSITLEELAALKVSAGFTDEDARFLHMAGDVLEDQTEAIVKHWRSGIIASIPNLARHSRSPANEPLPDYLAKGNLRFRQWILDTCFRPYDQDWLNYQQEIALRHTHSEEECHRSCPIDGSRSLSRHRRFRRRAQRNHSPLPRRPRSFRRNRKQDASGLAKVSADSDRYLGEDLHRAEAESVVAPFLFVYQFDDQNKPKKS